jgi:hypothetical protein
MIGGAISVLDKGMAYLDSCIFKDNNAAGGSAVYMLSSYEDSHIKSSQFINNFYKVDTSTEVLI